MRHGFQIGFSSLRPASVDNGPQPDCNHKPQNTESGQPQHPVNVVVSYLNLDDVLPDVTACLRSGVHHDRSALVLFDDETRRFQVHLLHFAKNGSSTKDRSDRCTKSLIEGTEIAKQIVTAVKNALASRELVDLNHNLADEKVNFGGIVGRSTALRRVLKEIETVAPTSSTVLIHGETGTGKELIARALHDLSPRRDRTFVKLNCAAIPTGLLESELFGHEKGAFTGAIRQRVGRLELANGGTMFLDEVGDIPLELQPKLLRVLQEQEFERLGSIRTIRVDVRLVAATNRDLSQMVAEGKFRRDLFYRLNVFPVLLPPLRDRSEDIPLLVQHFTQQFAQRMNRRIESIPAAVMEALVRYPWPGNVREMQNVIERAVILSQNGRLGVDPQSLASAPVAQELKGQLDARERETIEAALHASRGRVSGPNGAARRLGMPHSTLEFRIKKLAIDKFQFMRGESV